MAGVTESNNWSPEVYRFETEDVVAGGEDGLDNLPTKQLAGRTNWLRLLIGAVCAAESIPLVETEHTQLLTALDARISGAITALVDSSPAALDTLNELAAALGDDPNFASTITTQLSAKAKWSAIDHIITAAGMVPNHNNDALFKAALDFLYNGGQSIKYYASGSALPVADIGPIWHADYDSVMTWKVFNANDANFTGYASVLVGSLLLDTQATPRTGYLKTGTTNLSKNTYAALRGWAMHNGLMVAEGAWNAGRLLVCDNADGTTFKIYDVRGEFPRLWDDSRGVDTGRAFGTWQADEIKSHTHPLGVKPVNDREGTGGGANWNSGTSESGATGGVETRPRNVPFLGAVHF